MESVLKGDGRKLTRLRPRTAQSGPQKHVHKDMKTKYKALLRLIIVPVV